MCLVGVVVRRYIDFLILLIPTPLVSALFCSSIPTFVHFLILFYKQMTFCVFIIIHIFNIIIPTVHYPCISNTNSTLSMLSNTNCTLSIHL